MEAAAFLAKVPTLSQRGKEPTGAEPARILGNQGEERTVSGLRADSHPGM